MFQRLFRRIPRVRAITAANQNRAVYCEGEGGYRGEAGGAEGARDGRSFSTTLI